MKRRTAVVRVVGRDEDKALALWLPSEGGDGVLDLDDLDGAVLVAETEEFEVAVLRLLRLGVTVDLDAKVVAVRLPVDLALRNATK